MSPRVPISPQATKDLPNFYELTPMTLCWRTLLTVERIRKLVRTALRRPVDAEDDRQSSQSTQSSTESTESTEANDQRRPVIQYIRGDDAATD